MYYGFAISHELRTGFLFESDYASYSSVYDNVERCLELEVAQPVVVDWNSFECHTAGAAEGMEERLELMLADMVAGLPGLEEGYSLHPRVVMVSKDSRAEDGPEPEDCMEPGAEAVRAVAEAHGFDVRETCLCVWVSGDTRPHREELKAAGAKWSGKRQAWYWRKEQAAA